jgi:hypothetical protein
MVQNRDEGPAATSETISALERFIGSVPGGVRLAARAEALHHGDRLARRYRPEGTRQIH